MWFFSNVKLVLGSVGALVGGILIAIFRSRGKEIEKQKEQIENLEQEKKFTKVLDRVNEKIEEGYIQEDKEIEEHYEAKKEELFKTYSNKPLSPTLLSKLRDSQGLQDRSSKTSK